MRRITYFQGPVVLADVGYGARALALPQDESTAVVRIAAVLARNYGSRMPGEYRALVNTGDGAAPVVVAEEDPRIARARDLLTAITTDRDYTAAELAAVRMVLLESTGRSA